MKKEVKAKELPVKAPLTKNSPNMVRVKATEIGHLETGKEYSMPLKGAEYLASIGHVEIINEQNKEN